MGATLLKNDFFKNNTKWIHKESRLRLEET
jgi:hypothetical protein